MLNNNNVFRLDLWLEENILNRITQNFLEVLVVNYVHDALTNFGMPQ